MKILLVIPTFLPILGGAELAVKNIALHLKRRGINADILTFNIKHERWKVSLKTEIIKIEGIKIYRVGAFNLLFFLQNTKFKSLLSSTVGVQLIPSYKLYQIVKEYDIIHFNDEVNLSMPALLIPINKMKIFHIRTLIQLYSRFTKSILLRKILLKSANQFIVETDNYIKLLVDLGIDQKLLRRWNKGVDQIQFKKNIVNKKSENIKILFVSSRLNDSNKGLHILLEAIQKIKYPLKVIIVSKLTPQNEYTNMIITEIKKQKANGKKIFLIDMINQKNLIKLYNHSDIFVFPPIKDSMPNVLLEASCCELPIVTTRTGGIPDIVVDGKTGFIVNPGNTEQLREKIEILMKNSDLRRKFGKNARNHVIKNYSYEIAINKLISIYKYNLN